MGRKLIKQFSSLGVLLIFCILFKFKGKFSNQKNVQQFYHTVLKLNVSIDVVFHT